MITMTLEKSQPTPPRHRNTPRVHLEFIDPMAESDCIPGTFNDWRPGATLMIHLGAGRWVKELSLPPGTYEYRLVVDGEWQPDPQAGETIANPFCGLNSVMKVAPPASPHSSLQVRPPSEYCLTTLKEINQINP